MRVVLMLLFALGLIAGCSRNTNSNAPAPTDTTSAGRHNGMAARLEAAKSITYSNDRDVALAAVARDAAAIGEVAVTKAAIGAMTFVNEKDQAAANAALKLAEAKQFTAATEVAKMITFVNLRDATLKKLATGSH